MLCLLCTFFASDVYGAEKRLVKVAFFPMDGYHITNADGNYDGMDVEYLDALCEYTNWEIEYVKCNSWENALELLKNKQVDLVGSAQYSTERAEIYQYADLPSGYTFGVIATNADSTIAYEDFTAMRSASFGMVQDYVRKNEFLQYLRDHGIENPTIREFPTTADLQTALSEGKVDAMVHTFTEVKEGQRIVGRFAPRPFYYITYQGNDDVMRELNQAASDVKMNRPELETELMNKFYYDRFDKTALLTTGEHSYIINSPKITVGYLDGFYPFSYEEDGEFKGLTREMLDQNSKDTGLKYEYRKMASREDAQTALLNHEIDLLAYCADQTAVQKTGQLNTICDYADIPLVLVTKKDKNLDEIKTLATVPFLEDKSSSVIQAEKAKVVIYNTQQECVDAVKEDDVDAVLCDGYLAEYLMRTGLRYEDLKVRNVFSGEYTIAMAIRKQDETLCGILEKTISKIDSKTVNTYMMKENTYPLISAVDFVRNHSFAIIGSLVVIIIGIVLTGIHMIRTNRKVQKLMYKDIKMDIWNLNYLIFWGEHRLLPERKMQYALIYLNLAQFRRYNVIYGWDAGEHLLEGVCDILIKNVDARTEICARDQGDHFVMLLNYSNQKALMERIQLVKNEVEQWILNDTENHMLMQIGIYYIPENDSNLRLAINYASQALDFVGSNRGDGVTVYDTELEKMIKERHEREKLLESVDINKDFVAYYQPKVDIRNGKIVGAEALVRFLDPTEGGKVKAPGFFVPYYEQTGKITEIDFFVFESVCKMLRRRLDEGLPVVTISCNFSRMHFIKPDFPDRLIEILDRYQISKDLIEIEITETLVVEELQQRMVKKTLDILKERGIRLSIDDFGAGYSSLGVFEQIPASVIKLDRSFLLNQEDRGRQVKIMRGIVKLTEELEAQIVCEGVETEEDIGLMKEIGVYVAQGYFYSKPVPEAEFEEKLEMLA